ncbi:mycothiol conjugate amidase Mca [Plantibacter sp. Leaf171]|uniref:mycothiol conjugate amidase Mca n=1 Tax=unclassified Plantibacter TaxID=2624265 RepID=UPI0006FECF3B|nr:MULTISPECIES: mycothiol conjugate amidase Mca [unclassified Plantibacter]KQM15616.1 mycothiol conjugate amidase Mca [Plantibacter sp. Leaf1]KQR58760.1 mycothiol conjugate amidase Mca [Plantibacter sp. Leaf171]
MTMRLLAVHAHPDDESSKGAATLAYYRSLGAEVMVVSCTGGERGDLQNPGLADVAMIERDLPGYRRLEMAAAQEILDIEHRWLGYQDSGMARDDGTVPPASFADIPLEVSTGVLVRIVRSFRPQVIVTYDENGGYPHPDHIRCHEVSVAAFDAAADADRYPEAGDPWRVDKLYYDRSFSPARLEAVYAYLLEHHPDDPAVERLAEMREWMAGRPDLATTHVRVGDFFEARDDALRAHGSQVPPDSPFFFWPNDVLRAAWPFEDYQLVTSHVASATPESELFDGVDTSEGTA